jgi:hypothetical protein
VDERQNLSDHEALGFAVWQHCPIAKTEITEKKLLYLHQAGMLHQAEENQVEENQVVAGNRLLLVN